MKNKNRIYRAAALLLVLCFISTVMISGTFAKYTSEYSGSDTALVARWSFKGNFNDGAFETELPIWDHDYVENIYGGPIDGNYLIAPGVSGEFTVDFSYDADVDADLTFKFTKGGDAADAVPIQYSLDEFEDEGVIYYDLDELADAILEVAASKDGLDEDADTEGCIIKNTIKNTAGETEPTTFSQTVSWRWPYDVSKHSNEKLISAGFIEENGVWKDANDTAIGASSKANNGDLGRDSYVLTLTMKATQRMPGPTE